MKLHHTVNHIPNEKIAKSIEATGLIPQVADEYRDLVPEGIRHLPVVWFAEGIWQGWGFPVFEVDSGDLDGNKLHPCVADKHLHWWVYQGKIPTRFLHRLN